jgi:hypothetical protein
MRAPPGFLSLLNMLRGTALTSAAPRDMARHLAAAGGVAKVDCAPQIDRGPEFGDVRRVNIHVVTEDRLAGPSAASPVMGDNPVAMLEKEHHLAVPVVRAERPAMVEYDGLT